jgi:hypothetical protein
MFLYLLNHLAPAWEADRVLVTNRGKPDKRGLFGPGPARMMKVSSWRAR